MIHQLQCGRRHCIASFGYGAFLYWGDNQVGQLGNRKRAFLESPYPSKKFEYRHNVENVVASLDSTAVIVEDTGRVKKKKDKGKRIMKKSDIITSEDQLKARAEQLMTKEKESKDGVDKRGRKPLMERVREKFHERVYGGNQAGGKQGTPSKALQELIAKEKSEKEAAAGTENKSASEEKA